MTVVILMLSLLIIPFCLGLIFYEKDEGGLFIFAKGYILGWCLFFLTAIPCIIYRKTLTVLLSLYVPLCIGAALLGVLIFAMGRMREYKDAESLQKPVNKGLFEGKEWIYLSLFLGLWLFQMYKTVCFAFSDGDDAYYVSMATAINSGNGLYTVDPYTGIPSEPTYRYALAPFPVWIAALARLSGMHTATLSHIVLNVTLITITYAIYNETAKLLFEDNKEKRYMFMTLLAVFAVFSNVSQSMAETFMLTRARQGKEVLANIVIPILLYFFLRLMKKETFKVTLKECGFLLSIAFAGALTSLFANAIVGIALGGLFLYSFIRKSNIVTKLYIGAAALPALLTVALYWRLR